MKVLLATDAYDQIVNGVANVVMSLEKMFMEDGHDVRILTLANGKTSYKKDNVYYISSKAISIYPDARLSLKFNDSLLKEIREWCPDIMHIHTEFSARWLTMHALKGLNIPIIMTMHTNYEQFLSQKYNKNFSHWFAKFVCKHSYKKADLLIAPSIKTKHIAERYDIKCPIKVVNNGIDLSKYNKVLSKEEKAELEEKYDLKGKKVLVVVSRISAEKSIDGLISFMPKLVEKDSSFRLLIVGDGPAMEDLKKQVEDLNIKEYVIFTGMIDSSIVYKYYQLGDIFVCNSSFEMLSLTYIEALANGKPLVCRDDECLERVIEQGVNGYKYVDEDSFVEYVTKIFSDDKLREKMSIEAEQTSHKFSLENFYKNTLAEYNRVMEEKASN